MSSNSRRKTSFPVQKKEADQSRSPDSISAYFILGLTNTKRYRDLPKHHYFTGKCIISKLSHAELVDLKTEKRSERQEQDWKKTRENIERNLFATLAMSKSNSLRQLAKMVNDTYDSNNKMLKEALQSPRRCAPSSSSYPVRFRICCHVFQ